jgi:hypothetical protein
VFCCGVLQTFWSIQNNAIYSHSWYIASRDDLLFLFAGAALTIFGPGGLKGVYRNQGCSSGVFRNQGYFAVAYGISQSGMFFCFKEEFAGAALYMEPLSFGRGDYYYRGSTDYGTCIAIYFVLLGCVRTNLLLILVVFVAVARHRDRHVHIIV